MSLYSEETGIVPPPTQSDPYPPRAQLQRAHHSVQGGDRRRLCVWREHRLHWRGRRDRLPSQRAAQETGRVQWSRGLCSTGNQ